MTQRYPEIDYIKVTGILAVIVIHCIRPVWHLAVSEIEEVLNQNLRFAVPGFLFCSGFLYAQTRPLDFRVTLSRLKRIVVPYLIASAGAELYHAWRGAPRAADLVFYDIAVGNAFGHYYYVFIIVFLALATPFFAKLSFRGIVVLTTMICLNQIYFVALSAMDDGKITDLKELFWVTRSPLIWWNYFLFGWIVRHRYDTIRVWVTRYRPALVAILVLISTGLVAVIASPPTPMFHAFASWLQIPVMIAAVFSLTCGVRHMPTFLIRISEATYAIYLYHMFFLLPAEPYLRFPIYVLDPTILASRVAIGIVCPFLMIVAAKRLLKDKARLLLGA